MALTHKQQLFVAEFLVSLNATQAAKKAGYKGSDKQLTVTGAQNLAKPSIAEAVKKAMDERAEKIGITQDWVLGNLKTVAERCMQTAPVLDRRGNHVRVETPDGEEALAYTFNALGANKALELLGKHLGMFTDRLAVGGDPKAPPIQHDHTHHIAPQALIGFREDLVTAGLDDVPGDGGQEPVDTAPATS